MTAYVAGFRPENRIVALGVGRRGQRPSGSANLNRSTGRRSLFVYIGIRQDSHLAENATGGSSGVQTIQILQILFRVLNMPATRTTARLDNLSVANSYYLR